MQAARAAYLARKPLTDKQLRSGVLQDINDLSLWEVYGGRSECLAAPRNDVYRKRLVLWGRTLAQQDEAKEMEKQRPNPDSESVYGPSSPSRAAGVTSYTSRGPQSQRARPAVSGNPYEPLDDDDE